MDEYIELLIKHINDENAGVRWKAVYSMSNIISDERVVEPLIQTMLKDKDAEVRRLAASALAESEDARAVDPLIEALKDVDIEVRACALYSLGEIGNNKALPTLEWWAKNGTEETNDGFPINLAAQMAIDTINQRKRDKAAQKESGVEE